MKMTHIRNSTQIIEYAGKKFLIDPMLADRGAWPGFPGTARAELRNPLVGLPFSLETIIDVDAAIVTHTHDDHWDEAAIAAIPKTLPVFVQHDGDAGLLRGQGFQDVRLLSEAWQRPHLCRAGYGGAPGRSLRRGVSPSAGEDAVAGGRYHLAP